MDNYSDYDGIGLAELVAKKKVSPAELVEAAIVRVERHNPILNAVVYKGFDDARARAKGELPATFFSLCSPAGAATLRFSSAICWRWYSRCCS